MKTLAEHMLRYGNSRIWTILFLLFLLFLLPACGGERKVSDAEKGVPNMVPNDLLLYREARTTFNDWMNVFTPSAKRGSAYSLLSAKSLRTLRSYGVKTAAGFQRWFDKKADAGRNPFAYDFSRLDIIDIDVTDSNKAVITATFLVQSHDSQLESVGSFFLLRENGVWKVPFAESGDYERIWWQKEKNFNRRLQDKGLRSYVSGKLSIDIRYPVTWDIDERQDLVFPEQDTQFEGLRLRYLNPGTMDEEAVVWFAQRSSAQTDSLSAPDTTSVADSLRYGDFVLKIRKEGVVSMTTTYQGTVYILEDRAARREILIFTGVPSDFGEFERFDAMFKSIVKSISTVNNLTDTFED